MSDVGFTAPRVILDMKDMNPTTVQELLWIVRDRADYETVSYQISDADEDAQHVLAVEINENDSAWEPIFEKITMAFEKRSVSTYLPGESDEPFLEIRRLIPKMNDNTRSPSKPNASGKVPQTS